MQTNNQVYTCIWGRKFAFNDHVCIEMLFGVPDEKRTGRLVQVRKGCGQFGTDIYILRLRHGGLASYENAMIRHANDKRFEDAFYRSNGNKPPIIPEQPINEADTTDAGYTIAEKWLETGFIIEQPNQPQTPGSFSITITSPTGTKKETHIHT